MCACLLTIYETRQQGFAFVGIGFWANETSGKTALCLKAQARGLTTPLLFFLFVSFINFFSPCTWFYFRAKHRSDIALRELAVLFLSAARTQQNSRSATPAMVKIWRKRLKNYTIAPAERTVGVCLQAISVRSTSYLMPYSVHLSTVW